jgi:hypothetical protein
MKPQKLKERFDRLQTKAQEKFLAYHSCRIGLQSKYNQQPLYRINYVVSSSESKKLIALGEASDKAWDAFYDFLVQNNEDGADWGYDISVSYLRDKLSFDDWVKGKRAVMLKFGIS